MRVLHLVAVLVGLVLSPTVQAADAWPVPRGPSSEPRPYSYDAKKPPVIPTEFLEEATACILYAATTYRLEPDGTLVTTNHEVTRLNGRKGVEKLGEHRGISWDPGYEKVMVHEARIHKPDGKIVNAEGRDVQIRDAGTDYQVYDHDKQLVITFPTLGVGDVLEVKWTVRGKNAEHSGHLFRRYTFGDIDYPTVRDELRVLVPKGRALKHASINAKMTPEVKDVGDETLYFWSADNCKWILKDDGLPSKEQLRATVAVSTFQSWEEVGKWKLGLRQKCWECTNDVKGIVAEATKGLTDPLAKAKALTYWLRRNIRYVSIGIGHDYTPHLPGEVLTNRYGDCKDTSQMLAVMMREAGLKVELVTLGVLDDGQVLPEVPSPWGTHAILAVTIDGKLHWIDTTASLNGWDSLPRGDRDRMTYLTDEKGNIRLVKTPSLNPDENKMELTDKLYVGSDGTTRFERTVVAYGLAGRNLRDDLLEVPVGERRRQLTSELQDAFSNARLLELSVDEKGLRDFDAPVKMKVVFVVEDHFKVSTSNPAERDGNISDSKIWGRLLSWTLDYDRTVAFELFAPFQSTHHFEVYLPAAYSLEAVPRPKKITSAWGSFTLKLDSDPAADGGPDVAFTMITRADKVRVEPADFDKFRDFQAEVTRAYRVWMTMKPISELAETNLAEAQLHWLPEDGDTAAVLAKVYADNGKKDDARRVLARSLAYAPKSRALREIAVTLASNDDEEEAAQRKLVELFPDEVKYQINLAATLISNNKPDNKKRAEATKILAPVLKEGNPQQQADARYQLARAHYRVDELKEAEAELAKAEKVDPPSAERLRFRTLQGQVAEELGKAEEARKFYEMALRLNPEAHFPREALIRLAVENKDTEEALKHLRKLVADAKDDAMQLLAAADYSFRMERYADAEELAQRAEKVTSTEKGQRLLGLLALQRGEADKALPLLRPAAERARPDPIALEALLRAHLILGDLDKAISAAQKGEKLDTEEVALRVALKRVKKLQSRRDALLLLAPGTDKGWKEAVGVVACIEEAAQEIHSPERAQALTAKALQLAPKLGPALAWRGKLDLERGKLSRALPDAAAAIQATPGYWVGHYVRGVALLERDQDGLADLRQAAKLSQEQDAPTLLALGKALIKAKRFEEARQVLEKAEKLAPDLDDLKATLQSLRGAE
jgi:tetratricopeptide (TPR) repeat protein